MEEEGEGVTVIFPYEHKVAIATENGEAISAHFGSAPLFIVYTMKKGRIAGEEFRVNCRECSSRREDTQAACWELVEELLPDVRVVISGGMGENAYVGLLRRDVLPIITDEDDAQKAVQAYLRDRLMDNPQLVHRPKREGQGDYDIEVTKIRIMKGDAKYLDRM